MKTLIKIISILLLASLTLTCKSTKTADDYAGLGKAGDNVPFSQRTLTGTLPNGLRYYILENSFPENRAHLALVVNAGSVVESDDQRGFAHFVEHLAFNGTARFPEYELIEYLRSLGMRFGADANAYTSYDETVYHFDVPVEVSGGIKKIPQRALEILDDWTYAVNFHPQDVADESLVVLEELRARLGAMDRVRKIVLPILFAGSAYENRDVIGLAEQIESAASAQLRAFYDRWYRSDNMALVFVGDFDGKALEAELAKHFNMPRSSQSVQRPRHELPPPVSGNFHVEIIVDPELTSVIFDIYLKQKKGAQRGTLENYRESIIDNLIETMLSLRFNEAALDPKTAYSSAWGGIWRWSQDARFYNLGADAKTGGAEEALREILLEKESIRRFGFTQGELERAKIMLSSSMNRMLSERDKIDSRNYISGFTSHFLYGEEMPDIEWEVNAVSLLLPGIGLEEIARVTSAYFAANDINVFVLAPLSEAGNIPSAERIRAIFTETANTSLTQREDISLSGDLLDKAPSQGAVTSELTDSGTGALTLTLSNGANVILKETANRNNEIVMYAMARGGTAGATEQTIVSVDLLSEMIGFSGLGPYSRTELTNKLAGKQVSFSFWDSNFYRGFQGSSTTQDITTLFEMINLFFTNPRLDERAIEALVDQYRSYLAYINEDPQMVFSLELNKIIYNNHPLFMTPSASDMDKVSVRQAEAFLQNYLNPADYTFVFTGNIDINAMRELSKTYIASIPAAGRSMNSFSNPGLAPPREGRRTVYKGVDERSIVYIGWISQAPSVFNEQRNQAASVLSEYLNILLNDEIRENLGGVYSISSGASISVIPSGEYKLEVYFLCSPQRVDELINAVTRSISGVYERPLNTDIFNQAKEALLMGYENSMQQNLFIAQSYANSSVLYNTPLNRLNLRPDAIRAVTANDVQTLLRSMISSGPVQLVLYPESRR